MWGLVLQFSVPYFIVAAAARWWMVPIIRRGPSEFRLAEGDWEWCLAVANTALAAIGASYLATKSVLCPHNPYLQRASPRRLTYRSLWGVFAVVSASALIWALGIGSTHGFKEHFANPLVTRGGAESGAWAFFIPLGGTATSSACLALIGVAAMTWGRLGLLRLAFPAAIATGLSGLVLYSSGGRGAAIQFVGIAVISLYGARGRTVPPMMWAIIALLAVLTAMFGHTLFSPDAWLSGISVSLSSDFADVIEQPEAKLQKLVTFGQSVIHPVLIRDAMASGLPPHYFADVPMVPFYLLPKLLHGISYITLQMEFMELFPDLHANNNIKIVAYLFWGGGWVGLVAGGAVSGMALALVDRWNEALGRHPALTGPSVALAISFGVGLLNGGPAAIRDSLTPLLVLIVLRSVLGIAARPGVSR